jgi:flavin-dependent dehydrogenase
MQYRAASKPGLALIGDAAFAADPLWGVGCGWAFQSAGWLVDHTAAAFKTDAALDHALECYRKYHYRSLAGHRWVMTDVARGLRFPPIMRAFLYAAARDSELSNLLLDFGARRVGVTKFLSPRVTSRLFLKNLGRVWPFNMVQQTQS